jgi:hypothetical protein
VITELKYELAIDRHYVVSKPKEFQIETHTVILNRYFVANVQKASILYGEYIR